MTTENRSTVAMLRQIRDEHLAKLNAAIEALEPAPAVDPAALRCAEYWCGMSRPDDVPSLSASISRSLDLPEIRRLAERMTRVQLNHSWGGQVIRLTGNEILAHLDGKKGE